MSEHPWRDFFRTIRFLVGLTAVIGLALAGIVAAVVWLINTIDPLPHL